MLKVVDTTGMLRDNGRALRTVGEIVAENRDGTIKIATEGGDITVQKPAQRPDLIVGAKVDIEVPAGRPPRQITVRESTPPERTPQTPRSETPHTNTRPENAPPVVTTPARPPVSIPEQPPLPPVAARPAPVTPEQIVRLIPLTPEQAAQIILPPDDQNAVTLPALPLLPVVEAEAAAALIAAAAPALLNDALMQNVLTVPAAITQDNAAAWQSATPALPAILLYQPAAMQPPAPDTALDPVRIFLFMPAPAMQETALTPPLVQFSAPASPAAPAPALAAPFFPPPAARAFMMAMPENFIQTTMPATGATATWPAPPVTAGQVLPKMDAQVIRITPPGVIITPPGAPATPPPLGATPSLYDAPAATAQPGMMQATVRGVTAQNQPVLALFSPAQNIIQNFVMQFPADNMPSAATVTVLPQPGSIMPAFSALPTPLPELFAPGLWPAFDDMFQALQQAAPQTAQILAQANFPSATSPARLPAVAMMFIAAIKGGDIQSWLGDKTIDALRRAGKGETLARITRDGATLSRIANAEPANAQEWRSLPLPMIADNHVYKIFLHYRHDREKQKDGPDKTTGTRFILDIHPHRMGDVQLDGLHRPPESGNRLDLIIRTKELLSPPMQQSMRRLYIKALDSAQLSGELSFQNRADAWVRITPGA